MGDSALPRWLDWAWQLRNWCPIWPHHGALLRTDGLDIPDGRPARAGADLSEEMDPLEDWESHPGEFELMLESITDLDPDFTRYIRQPTPGDLWLEERIKEHLAPLLKPDEPAKCAPPYDDTQESQWSPQCREAHQAIIEWVSFPGVLCQTEWSSSIERWIALPKPMPDMVYGSSTSQQSWMSDRNGPPRCWAKAIRLARTLRMQGKLWESVRQYQKANLAFRFSLATQVEEADAVSEAEMGKVNTRKLIYFGFKDIETLAMETFFGCDAYRWHGKEDTRTWDGPLTIISSFRPATEPSHSLFRLCLSCLAAIDNILLFLTFRERGPQNRRLQLIERVRSSGLAACALIWQASDRLRLRSKLFIRRRVILSFRRSRPRCDISIEVVSASLNIGLDAIQLVAQNRKTLNQLQDRLSCLGDTVRPQYIQELAIIQCLRGSQDEKAFCSVLKALARYLDDARALENTQAIEYFISALLLYESPTTASIHHRLRQLLWSLHSCSWYFYEPIMDYMVYHPLVIRLLAEVPPVPDTWRAALFVSFDAPSKLWTPSLGPDHGSSTVAGIDRLGTESLFATGARDRSSIQFARNCWLLSAWFHDEPEHSLLALHLVEYHHLFSRQQHAGRLSTAASFAYDWFLGQATEDEWRACRYAYVRDRPLPTEVAALTRALQSEKQHVGLLLEEIGAILQSNAALPKRRRLSSRGMETLNIDARLFAADAQAELAGVLSGEAKVLALATARHEYVSTLAMARQALPSTAPSDSGILRFHGWRGHLSFACKHGELGLLRVERELLGMESLIGGPPELRITCLRAEKVLREDLYSRMRNFLASDTIYTQLYHLQDTPQHTDFSTVYATGRELALIAGDPVEALWWQQSGKAEMTSAYIVDRRIRAELASWKSDSSRSLTWASAIERLERLRRLGRLIQAMAPNQPGAQPGNRGISDIISRRRLDSSCLRAIFPRSEHPLTTDPSGAAGRRIVWLDWVEDTESQQYHLTFAPFGESPIHLHIPTINPTYVKHWIGQSWKCRASTRSTPEAVSPLRDLDDLIKPLQTLLLPEDELVICPTGLLHAIPLHALHIAVGVPLVQLYPVLYATSLAAYLSCVSRSESPSDGPNNAALAAIYRPLPRQNISSDFDHNQAELHDILQDLSAQVGASFLWDAAVTPSSFANLLQTHRAVLFCGHCSSGPNTHSSDSVPRLILHAGDLSTSDLFDYDLPSSLLVLIACGSSEQTMGILDEPMGLPAAALVAGAATVVGTMWSVRLVPAVRFIQRFLYWLGHPDTKMDAGMINIARAVQHASLDVRERFSRPADWAGYVLHGSPVMRDMGLGQLEDPSSLIGGT